MHLLPRFLCYAIINILIRRLQLMQKSLLLGNGINMHFGISDLYLTNIADRFKDVLTNSSPLYECLFGVSFTPALCDSLFSSAPNLGIETLSAEIFKYVYTHMKDQSTLNSEYRLHNAIKTSAINAIFYNKQNIISITDFNQAEINVLKKYHSIYSLNYTEFWDTEDLCTYLHGVYEPMDTNSNAPILLYSSKQYRLLEYKKVVINLSTQYNMLAFNGYNIVFSPLLDKQKILGLAHYPAKNLYPAEDLFPYNPPKLYTELDSVSSLDVFGMSPFGDDKLINRLMNIDDLTIYVYRMDNSEVSEWNKLLNRNCCKDSSLFWDEGRTHNF